jgi:hypothetical protein
MAGKMGKKITGTKPSSSTRTSSKTDGAFGKEQMDRVKTKREVSRDKASRAGG